MNALAAYHDLLAAKSVSFAPSGIEDGFELHPGLFPYQADVTRLLLACGRGAGFLDTGLMGIGSEGFVAMQEGRRFLGTELNPAYFAQSVRNIGEAEAKGRAADLFAEVAA